MPMVFWHLRRQCCLWLLGVADSPGAGSLLILPGFSDFSVALVTSMLIIFWRFRE
jgi:hypothetical protein